MWIFLQFFLKMNVSLKEGFYTSLQRNLIKKIFLYTYLEGILHKLNLKKNIFFLKRILL